MVWYEDVVKPREYIALPSIVENNQLGIFNNTCRAACVALTERYLNLKIDGVLTAPIKPDVGAFAQPTLIEFRNILVRRCYGTPVLSRREVVDLYTGAKKKLYQEALESLDHTALAAKDWMLKTFIKFEKCVLSKAPRIINPRSVRYNLEVARYLKKLEKTVYRAINNIFRSHTAHTVIKGLNVVESARVIRQKWDRFVHPAFVGGDITKLDMHIDVEALKFEHSAYNLIFRSNKLRRLLKKQLVNRGRAYFKDGHVSFVMHGTRCSGDINTSTGNVIIVCAVLFHAIVTLNLDCEVIDNGDDFGIILEQADVERLVSALPGIFFSFGFRLTMEKPVDEFEHIEFCQTKPVFDGEEWRMCRIPSTVFKKDTICTIPVQSRSVWRQWLHAVGTGGLSLTAGLPVLPNFYRAFRRSGQECKETIRQVIFKNTSMFEKLDKLTKFSDNVTSEARLSFYIAFGITPDEQLEAEAFFDNLVIEDEFDSMLGTIRDNNLVHPIFKLCDTETIADPGGLMGFSKLVW